MFQTRIHEQNIREKTSSAVLSRTLYEQKNGRKPTSTVLEFGRREWRLERRIGHDSILYNPLWFRRGGKCVVTSWKNPLVVSKTNFDKHKWEHFLLGVKIRKACFKKTPAKDFVNAVSLGKKAIISTIATPWARTSKSAFISSWVFEMQIGPLVGWKNALLFGVPAYFQRFFVIFQGVLFPELENLTSEIGESSSNPSSESVCSWRDRVNLCSLHFTSSPNKVIFVLQQVLSSLRRCFNKTWWFSSDKTPYPSIRIQKLMKKPQKFHKR